MAKLVKAAIKICQQMKYFGGAEFPRNDQQMLQRLPGYLVPRWVRDTAGAAHKQEIETI